MRPIRGAPTLHSPLVRRPAREDPRHVLLAASLLAPLVFLAFLGREAIVSSHEERVVDVSLAMAESGWPWAARPVRVPAKPPTDDPNAPPVAGPGPTLDVNPWLVPVMEGRIRLQKPPLPAWCTAVTFRLMGATPFTARLAPALLGVASTALVYLLALRLVSRRSAAWVPLVWASTYFIFDEHRKAMADPYLAFLTLAAALGYVAASSPRAARRASWLLATYAAVGLALLVKGPVVLLHVVVAGVAFTAVYRRRPRAPWTLHAAGVVLTLAVALPWAAHVARAVPDAVELWRYESIGRFDDTARNPRPWFFYAAAPFQLPLPWTALLVVALASLLKRPTRPVIFAAAWFGGTILLFSFSNDKKNAYLLPAMPAMVLAASRMLPAMIGALRRRRRRPGDRWAAPLLAAHLVAAAAAGMVVAALTLAGPLRLGGRGGATAGQLVAQFSAAAASPRLAVALLALAAGLAPALPAFRRRPGPRTLALAAAFALLLLTLTAFRFADVENLRRPRVLVPPAQARGPAALPRAGASRPLLATGY